MATIPGLGERLVGQPEVGERAQRALNVKGEMPSRLEPELSSSVTVEDFSAFEYWWLRRGLLFQRGVTQAAGGAGQFGFISLAIINQAQVLAICDQIILHNPNGTALEYKVGLNPASGGAANELEFANADDRQAATQFIPGAARIFNGVSLTAGFPLNGGDYLRLFCPATGSLIVPVQYVIKGTMNLYISALASNVAMGGMFRWRERTRLNTEG
jgi:hypothetical protein